MINTHLPIVFKFEASCCHLFQLSWNMSFSFETQYPVQS